MKRFLAPLLVTLAVLVALLFAVAWLPIVQAREAWRAGQNAEAIAIAQRWSFGLWPSQYHQLLAVAYLSAGNTAAARPHLARIGRVWLPAVDKGEVARRLAVQGGDADFLAYDVASHEARERAEVRLYRAAALTVTNQISSAESTLRSIDPSRVELRKYDALRAAIEARKRGSVPFVFDRTNRAIALYRPQTGEVISMDPDFAPLIDRQAGALTIGARLHQLGTGATVETTLDPFVQKAALAALGNYRGSLVAIDPRTNEIVAIANSTKENLALEREYEPGSVVKVLTGLNALASGLNVDAMFPYVCNGELMIDGRHFGDWMPQGHGRLNNIDDALAVSCNVFFADVGLRLGRDRLARFMNSAGFDGQVNLGIFQVPLGKTVGRVFNNFETAFQAIGLQHEEINAMHLAMLASMMANRGVLTTPRLLRGRRSILGDLVTPPPLQGRTQIASQAAAARMIHAMQAVITEPRGTGRRASVEGITVAMKTGTAGERKNGLEALIMAFAPVESPKIAFGVIAESAGPAEYAGAKIAHDFLERIKSRM